MPTFGFGSNEPNITPGGDRVGGFAQKIKELFADLYDKLNSVTWSNATQSSAGFMSVDDKKKLDCIYYGECSTAAATAAKVVTCAAFTLAAGSRVIVKFTVTNTAASPTLNVNSTGAKAIQYRGAAITAGYLAANRTYEFVYDGTSWQLVGDTDTHMTSHLYAGASNGTANAATTNGNTYLILCDNTTARDRRKIAGSGATTVTSDASGNITIASTNTTYSNFVKSGSSAAAGLVPKPSTTAGTTKYLREDASWQVPPDTNTHYASHFWLGAKQATSQAAQTNGNVWLTLCDDTTVRNYINLVGSGATSVVCDGNGKATFSSTNTTYSNMTAASSSAAGKAGLVPAPAKGKQASFLRGDATWAVPTDNNTTYSNMTACTTSAAGKAGLVPAPAAGVVSRCLLANATWGYPAQIATARTITAKIKIGSTTFSGNASFNGTSNVTIDLGTVS